MNFTLYFLTVFFGFIAIFLLTTLRSYNLYRCFININFHTIAQSNIHGAWYGIFNIPLLGNLLGQNIFLKDKNIPSSLTSSLMLAERILMLVSGLILGAISLPWFYKSGMQISNDLVYSAIEFFLALALIFFIFKKLKYIRIEDVKKVIHNNMNILPISILPFLQWCILAYVFSLGPQIVYGTEFSIKFYCFSFMIAFISSLPISIAGFGLRELACVVLFDTFGMTQTEALTLSLIVGVGSIGSIAFLFFSKQYWIKFLQKNNIQVNTDINNHNNIPVDTLFFKGIILLVSILIFFQFHFSSGLYTININLADPMAAVGFVYLVLNVIQKKWQELKGFPLFWFLSIIAALCIGTLTAIFKGEVSTFGGGNKGLGFLILIGYTYIGFLSVKKQTSSILSKIVELQVISLIIICLWKFIVMIGVSYEILPKILLWRNEFEGFSQDRNAFGFILTIVILTLHHVTTFMNFSTTKKTQLIGFLTYAVYLTHSKTAIISLSILFVFLLLTNRVNLKKIITYLLYGALCSITAKLPFIMIYIVNYLLSTLSFGKFTNFSSETSMHERMDSIYTGLRLFIQSPIFGAGLGNFKELWIKTHGHALIIHNSFVWILAEMGLIGFFSIYTAPIKWLWGVIKDIRKLETIKTETSFFLGLSLIFVLFSLPQDVFYQRIFWFWLGINFALQPHVFDHSKILNKIMMKLLNRSSGQ